ncbi:MAG TPA: hypothetical protein VE175_04555 [Woeseiaceae bacterium]|nr:hypothetical protein [Woeseiaceae bacterium]
MARLDEIRERGYENMPSTQMIGVFPLSAPVRAADGRAIAALTVLYIGLVEALDAPDNIDGTVGLLLATTGRLSQLAGAGMKPVH